MMTNSPWLHGRLFFSLRELETSNRGALNARNTLESQYN